MSTSPSLPLSGGDRPASVPVASTDTVNGTPKVTRAVNRRDRSRPRSPSNTSASSTSTDAPGTVTPPSEITDAVSNATRP